MLRAADAWKGLQGVARERSGGNSCNGGSNEPPLSDYLHWSATADFPSAPMKGSVADMRFVTTLDRDEDGVWVAECPAIPGCVSQGETREQALANIRDAIAACLAVRAQRGMPLTIETQEVEVVL